MQTGEQDEETVESVVSEDIIHEHEEEAELFVYTAAGVTVLFILGIALPRPAWRSAAMGGSVLASVIVAGLALNTGHSGGEMVYVHGAATAHTGAFATAPGEALAGEYDHDDD